MKRKKTGPFKVFVHAYFIIYSLACLLPFLLLIAISFTDEATVRNGGYSLIPEKFSTEAYAYILRDPEALLRAYGVTIIAAFGGAVIGILIIAALGYSLSRDIFLFKKGVTIYLLITMLFNGGIIPSYIINTQYLNINNTIWAYLLLSIFDAYTVFVFRTFFSRLPKSLIESASIDGASEFTIMTRIIFPLSKPVLATFLFLRIVTRWNDFEIPLYYITDAKLYNLQFLLQKILNEAEFLDQMAKTMVGVDLIGTMPKETLKFAMCVLASGPMLFVFPFFQKYFSKGMVVGAVKG